MSTAPKANGTPAPIPTSPPVVSVNNTSTAIVGNSTSSTNIQSPPSAPLLPDTSLGGPAIPLVGEPSDKCDKKVGGKLAPGTLDAAGYSKFTHYCQISYHIKLDLEPCCEPKATPYVYQNCTQFCVSKLTPDEWQKCVRLKYPVPLTVYSGCGDNYWSQTPLSPTIAKSETTQNTQSSALAGILTIVVLVFATLRA